MHRRACRPWVAVLFVASLFAFAGPRVQAQAVEINRDVRPILSNHCCVCHGPDNNLGKAKLRLDGEKNALANVLVPRKPAESELFQRVISRAPDERMPPDKHNKPLSKDQIEVLRRWIEQGAKYEKHWSLIA